MGNRKDRPCHRRSNLKKQYKPIKFGDRPDPGTVEGHRDAIIEAAETREYNRRMKELAAEDEARREGLVFQGVWILLEEIEEILRFNSHRSRIQGSGFPHLLF